MSDKPAFLQSFLKKWVYNPVSRAVASSDMGSFLTSLFGDGTASGENVTVKSSLKLHAVYTSINVLSESIAGLPVKVYRKQGDKKNHVHNIISNLIGVSPDGVVPAFSYWYTVTAHVKGWGNSYSLIERNGYYEPVRIKLLNPWEVEVVDVDGQIWYRHGGKAYRPSDMLHFRMYTLDGVNGLSPIRQNAETVGGMQKLNRYGNQIIGERPPGLLSTDQNLTPEQRDQQKKNWQAQVAGENAGKTVFLGGGIKYTPFMVPPVDAQYIETSNYSNVAIYGIFRVPPTLAQNYERATFTNGEHQDLTFVKYTLSPIVRCFEQELNLKLFPIANQISESPFYVKFNLAALLRGDHNSRKEFYQAMLNTGVFSPNEVRELEDMNPYEGGDRYYVQGAMIPTDKIDEFLMKKTSGGTVPGGNKQEGNENQK